MSLVARDGVVAGFPTITDPTYTAAPRLSLLERAGMRLIRDPRDLPFLALLLKISFTLLPAAAVILSGAYFSWWFAVLYLAGMIYWLGPFVLLLHNVSHRPFFRREYRFLNIYIDWVAGPFFGLTPSTYFAHHIGMHHPENNLADDVSSTLRYQRDGLMHFLQYLGRFLAFSCFDLTRYFWQHKRKKLLWFGFVGEFVFWTAAAIVASFNWQAALVVFLIPVIIVRFGLMSGNWAQHAFVDAEAPENIYRNSITCINTTYNRRCFNDGYHTGHHLKPNRHWTDMPADFMANRETYRRERAIVFEGLDYLMIWFLLMSKQYGVLARHVVDLGDHRSEQETVALLRQRTRLIAATEPTLPDPVPVPAAATAT